MTWHNPPVRGAVIAALQEHGPMTVHDIAELLDWPLARVQRTVSNTRALHPGEIFRVTGYKRAAEGKGKDASIYAAEAGPDQPRKTKVAHRLMLNRRRYKKKHSARINARTRAVRADKAGRSAQANPWAGLMPVAVRSSVTRLGSAHKSKKAEG